jgi:transcriptional regulator with XRE-family HTH domain
MSINSQEKALAARLKQLRESKKYSQEIVAENIGVPRTAISQIENNERGVSGAELARFAQLFEVSTDYILGLEEEPEIVLPKETMKTPKQEIRISIPAINLDKFKQILLYVLERCAGKPNIGETVLYKLLYFADFNYYETYEEQMTGASYKKSTYGPIPVEFQKVVQTMEKAGEIKPIRDEFYGYSQKRYIPLKKPDLSKLKASEKEILDKVISTLSDKTAKEISDYSHEDIPWKATKDKEVIDYELVFYRSPAYSVRSYSEEE